MWRHGGMAACGGCVLRLVGPPRTDTTDTTDTTNTTNTTTDTTNTTNTTDTTNTTNTTYTTYTTYTTNTTKPALLATRLLGFTGFGIRCFVQLCSCLGLFGHVARDRYGPPYGLAASIICAGVGVLCVATL
jgi:hypothetical protein